MDTCLYNISLGVLIRWKVAKRVVVGFLCLSSSGPRLATMRNAYEALELKQRMAASALNEAREMMVIPSLACCLSYKANSLRG